MATEKKEPLYSQSDLESKSLDYLRRCHPKAFKEMKKDGSLDEYTAKKAKAAKDYAENLMKSGIWEEEAWNRAIRLKILRSESD